MINHRLNLYVALALCAGVTNGLNARTDTPPMGWNSYNYYSCYPDETIMKTNAQGLVDLGFADLGYNVVTTDCGWPSRDRTADGKITWNSTLFPSGFPALGEYIHDLGLQFGLYSGAGVWECDVEGGTTHLQASLGHETEDVQTFAEWGGDSLKYDNCWSTGTFVDYTPQKNTSVRFQAMADALDAVDRSIVYYICEWGVGWNVGDWASALGDTWRISNDIQRNWASIWRIANEVIPYTKNSGIGKYPDMDMLIVGLGALSFEEERFHFGLWAISKSPLIIGAPMDTTLTPSESLDIMSNEEVIALNQDSLGKQARLIRRYTEEEYDVWASNLSDSRMLVAVTNWANSSTSVNLNLLNTVGLEEAGNARDAWAKQDLGPIADGSSPYEVQLNGHEIKLLVLSDISITTPPWQTVEPNYYSAANATLSGQANVKACVPNPSPHECSPTQAKVWNMTAGSSILFENVQTASSTNSSSTVVGVDYINYDIALDSAWTNGTNTRNLTISVNNGTAKRWAFPISGGDWYDTGRLWVELEGLHSGSANTVLVEAPGIDDGPNVVGLEVY